jgi:hypothetical protein
MRIHGVRIISLGAVSRISLHLGTWSALVLIIKRAGNLGLPSFYPSIRSLELSVFLSRDNFLACTVSDFAWAFLWFFCPICFVSPRFKSLRSSMEIFTVKIKYTFDFVQ